MVLAITYLQVLRSLDLFGLAVMVTKQTSDQASLIQGINNFPLKAYLKANSSYFRAITVSYLQTFFFFLVSSQILVSGYPKGVVL